MHNKFSREVTKSGVVQLGISDHSLVFLRCKAHYDRNGIEALQFKHLDRNQGNKEICRWQTTVCHPGKGQFVINGRSGGHSCDKAPPLKAVLLRHSPLDVPRSTAITLMVG